MKTILILLLAFNLNAQGDTWQFQRDKQLHFGVGTAFGATFTHIALIRGGYNDFDAIVGAQMLLVPIGMAKEWVDFTFRTGQFSWHDIAYNQIGCLTGSLITYGIHKGIEHRNKKRQKLKL